MLLTANGKFPFMQNFFNPCNKPEINNRKIIKLKNTILANINIICN